MLVFIYEYQTCNPCKAHPMNLFKDGFAWIRTAGVKQMNKHEFDKYMQYIKSNMQSAKFSQLSDGSVRVRYFNMGVRND